MPIPLLIPVAAALAGAGGVAVYKSSQDKKQAANKAVKIPVFSKSGGGYARIENNRIQLPSGNQAYISATNPTEISTKYLLIGAGGLAVLGFLFKVFD